MGDTVGKAILEKTGSADLDELCLDDFLAWFGARQSTFRIIRFLDLTDRNRNLTGEKDRGVLTKEPWMVVGGDQCTSGIVVIITKLATCIATLNPDSSHLKATAESCRLMLPKLALPKDAEEPTDAPSTSQNRPGHPTDMEEQQGGAQSGEENEVDLSDPRMQFEAACSRGGFTIENSGQSTYATNDSGRVIFKDVLPERTIEKEGLYGKFSQRYKSNGKRRDSWYFEIKYEGQEFHEAHHVGSYTESPALRAELEEEIRADRAKKTEERNFEYKTTGKKYIPKFKKRVK